MAHMLTHGGKVYAVDHWLGSVEHQEGNSAHSPLLPRLYEQFLSNVINADLTDKIIPIRMDSVNAAIELIDLKPDLIYIDGDHSTEGVKRDLNAWYPFVQGHGILCGDDWSWPTVSEAVVRFAQENRLEVIAEGNFWMYKERE